MFAHVSRVSGGAAALPGVRHAAAGVEAAASLRAVGAVPAARTRYNTTIEL